MMDEKSSLVPVNQIVPIQEQHKQKRRFHSADPSDLYTLSLSELYEISYHSKPPVIEGLLCIGVYILAGAPKIGKSFLVTQLAYHVSTGEKLWGLDVRQGSVLYLALEDSFQRIQSRMFSWSLWISQSLPHLRHWRKSGLARAE